MKRSDLPFKNARARAIVRAVAIFGLAGGCAAVALAASNRVSITRQGDTLVIQSNGIADHAVGQFPNRSNPNAISEQDYTFVVDATEQSPAGDGGRAFGFRCCSQWCALRPQRR